MSHTQHIGPIKQSENINITQNSTDKFVEQDIETIENVHNLSIKQSSSDAPNHNNDHDEYKDNIATRSPWASGLFYLFVFFIVIGCLGYLANVVPAYALTITIIAGILFVPLVGVFQLRQDDRLSDKSLLELTKLIIKKLPLISTFTK